jgi:hypothetical protein
MVTVFYDSEAAEINLHELIWIVNQAIELFKTNRLELNWSVSLQQYVLPLPYKRHP